MEVDGKRLDDEIVSELCEPCREGNVSTQADGYCNDCEEYMCQSCFQNHVKIKILRNHVLGALDGEKSQFTKKLSLEEKCKKHTSENMKYYCRNHDFVGCGDCIIPDHRQCEPKFMKDLATNFEESSEFKTLLKRTQEWDAVKAEAENCIERDRKLNNILVDNAVKGMRTFRKEINDWLNKMETGLEKEVKKISNDNEIQMSKQEKNIKSVSQKIYELKEEMNPNLNTGDKLFIRTVECKHKICDIGKAVLEIKSGYVIKSCTFEPDIKFREMLASSVTFGIIKLKGNQPPGTMQVLFNRSVDCAGYPGCGHISINYEFPSGRQMENHPNPGKWYKGIVRVAYLPNNKEGNEVLELLKVAFDRKLVFTIGRSRTTGHEGVITWNDIHHKTDPRPNTQFGYPDPGYFARVKDELAAKGVTLDDLNK